MKYPDVNRRLSISLEKKNQMKKVRIYLQDSDDAACSKDEEGAFPELQDVASMHVSSWAINR